MPEKSNPICWNGRLPARPLALTVTLQVLAWSGIFLVAIAFGLCVGHLLKG